MRGRGGRLLTGRSLRRTPSERKPRRSNLRITTLRRHKHLLVCNHDWGIDTGSARRAVHRGRPPMGRGRARRAQPSARAASCSPRSPARSRRRSTMSPRAIGRGAPAVSRSVDALVRAGLVERTQDPEQSPPPRAAPDRRRAASSSPRGSPAARRSRGKLERLAHSELRALERAIEILERGARPQPLPWRRRVSQPFLAAALRLDERPWPRSCRPCPAC